MNIEYTVQIWKEGNQYIAHAMPLDVMSSGITPEEAKRAVKEAVDLFIATAKEMGTLNDILEECGYRRELKRLEYAATFITKNCKIQDNTSL